MAEDGGETRLEFSVRMEGIGGEFVENGLVGGIERWGFRERSRAVEWLCARIKSRRARTWRYFFHGARCFSFAQAVRA